MSFLSRLFGRKPSSEDGKTPQMQKVPEWIGCDCTFLPGNISGGEQMRLYLEEYEKGKTAGYTPVIVWIDKMLAELVEDAFHNIPDVAEYHNSMCALASDGGRTFLHQRFTEQMQCLQTDFEFREQLYGEWDDRLSPLDRFDDAKDGYPVLLRVPVTEPWNIFAWVPFGGWNECPADEDMMGVCRYWYEQYHAVPAVLSGDTLQMYCFAPVRDKDTALPLAEEQYGFCNDAVEQGAGTIKRLASRLIGSRVWYFWWD